MATRSNQCRQCRL